MHNLTLDRILPWLLVVCGVIGLAMAALITIEDIQLLQHPASHFICDVNPIISCGSVMQAKQAKAFGFPNPLIGLAAWPVVITTGVVLLQKFKPKRWYWLGLQASTIFGLLFVHWLMFQTTYRIHALCPYCIVTWIVTITTFWYVLLYNLQERYIVLPSRVAKLGPWLRKHHLDILVLWFVVIAFFIVKHFWYYFGRNF